MPQFRPLPRFDTIEEAESVEVQPTVITDSIPSVSTSTSGRMPIVLLTGPHPTSDTDQLAALIKSPNNPTSSSPSLIGALQASMQNTGTTRRLIVIPADARLKKVARPAHAPIKRLNPHLRNSVLVLAFVGIFFAAMLTLMPLSDGQGSGGLLSSLGMLIQVARINMQVQAHQSVSQMPTNPDLPSMSIADSAYVSVAQQAAIAVGISPVYFVRQINQESGFNPYAVSPAGAEGIAQFMPATAANLGINPWNPDQALRGGAQMMADAYHQYGDYAKALANYNAGPGQLNDAVNACGVNWLSCMPAETQHYVYIIMGE